MRYLAVATDYDGTLAYSGRVHPDVFEALQRLKDSGRRLILVTGRELPDLHLVNVPGQADLMFCREQTALSIDDLERILHPCRGAYYEQSMTPQSSPHARFDIQDWTPLDP